MTNKPYTLNSLIPILGVTRTNITNICKILDITEYTSETIHQMQQFINSFPSKKELKKATDSKRDQSSRRTPKYRQKMSTINKQNSKQRIKNTIDTEKKKHNTDYYGIDDYLSIVDICNKFNFSRSVLNNIKQELNIQCEQRFHIFAKRYIDVFSPKQIEQIQVFLSEHPNTRLYFRQKTYKQMNVNSPLEIHQKKTGEPIADIREKAKKTTIQKYGTLSLVKKYQYDNIRFDSAPELYFYIYYKEILKKEIRRGDTFEYIVNGQKHIYECDFFVDGTNIEIKGEHFIDAKGDLIFPYTDKNNKYKTIWSAKNQCMKQNNIKVITSCSLEMQHIIKEVERIYTKDYVNLFKYNLPFPFPNTDLENTSDIGIIKHFHKSIYYANRKGKPKPIDAWNDKNIIKKVAQNRLKYIGRCQPNDILQGFNVTRIANKVTVFKPSVAEQILKTYCTTDKIFDPFSGFSGRMIASKNLNKLYKGQDINKTHIEESQQIIKYKGYKNCEVTEQDILKDHYHELPNYTLFTCPPYTDKEQWNENETIKECDDWITLCLQQYKCKEYIFVVDKTTKYKNFIVDTITNKSHFNTNKELILYITC